MRAVEGEFADGARAARHRDRAQRLADAAPVWLSLALSAFLLAQLLDYGYGRDQGIYAVVADALQRGEPPYKAAWDFKPPGIFFVFALAELGFGPSPRAVRLLEALGLLSLFPAFAALSRWHLGSARAGIVGAAVALLGYVPLEWWDTAQPEGFGGILLAWALVAATWRPAPGAGARSRQLGAWVGSGALYAAATLLKPSLGGGILVSAGAAAAARLRAPRRASIGRATAAPAAAFALGGALPLLAALGYFAAKGALPDLYQSLFVFAPRYVAVHYADEPFSRLLGIALGQWLFRMTPFHLLGLVALLALPVLHPRERAGLLHVLGVVAFSLLGVALQAKFFAYHYAAAILLTGLLAGWGYWKLWRAMRRSLAVSLAVGTAGCALALIGVPGAATPAYFFERSDQRLRALWDPAQRRAIRESLYSMGDVDARENRLAAEWLARHTPPDSTLYVWGFQPVLYDLAGRSPASRFIYNAPQRASWTGAPSRALLMRDLARARPAAVVVIHRDRDVFLTVLGERTDSADALGGFPELAALLRRDYAPATRVGDLEILTRRAP